MLLQIGEVGQKFDKKRSLDLVEPDESRSDDVDSSNVEEDKDSDEHGWSISFEQFLASILTEPSLVDHFSVKTDLQVPSLKF